MTDFTRRPLALVAALFLLTACQSADRGPVGSTSVAQEGDGASGARAAVDPVPVPGKPGTVPVPGRGGSTVPGKPAPAPVPGAPNSGPAPGAPAQPTPAPSATPDPGATPTPAPSPSPSVRLTVSNVQAASGAAYQIVSTTDCCANSMGPGWIDYPYVLQSNFGAGPDDPLYMVRTAIADTDVVADPAVTFEINTCARVQVFFPDDVRTVPPYPSWIVSQGWFCTVDPSGGGTVSTWYHQTAGAADQISGPWCTNYFGAGTVELGPREPTDPGSVMYAIFVKAPSSSVEAENCPP
jgi:hypothetical protein